MKALLTIFLSVLLNTVFASSDLNRVIKAKMHELNTSEKRIVSKLKRHNIASIEPDTSMRNVHGYIYASAPVLGRPCYTSYHFGDEHKALKIKLWLPIELRDTIKATLDNEYGRSEYLSWDDHLKTKNKIWIGSHGITIAYVSQYCVITIAMITAIIQ